MADAEETTMGSENSSCDEVGGVVGPADDAGECCGVSVVESGSKSGCK